VLERLNSGVFVCAPAAVLLNPTAVHETLVCYLFVYLIVPSDHESYQVQLSMGSVSRSANPGMFKKVTPKELDLMQTFRQFAGCEQQ
jgi:hypothetical protein